MTALWLALWKLLKPHAGVILGGMALFAGGGVLGYHLAKPPTPSQTVQQAHQTTIHLWDTVRAMDTVVVRQTRQLSQTDTLYQQIRDTLLRRITDTVVVKEFLTACDSLRASCTAFRVAAQSKFHADSLLFHAQDQELHAWQASQPSRLHGLLKDALIAGVALEASQLAHHPPSLRF